MKEKKKKIQKRFLQYYAVSKDFCLLNLMVKTNDDEKS